MTNNISSLLSLQLIYHRTGKFGERVKIGDLVVYLCNHQVKIHQYLLRYRSQGIMAVN